MVKRKMILKVVALLALVSCAASGPPQVQGRKLFGGYRIAPKVCRPTNPSRIRSDVPAVCMFNYECTRRRGEVVGACMDGFLFGACCQLPGRPNLDGLEKTPLPDELDLHEIDHVPDVPILLNPDGSPVGSSTGGYGTKDVQQNAERPQIIQLEEDFPALLGHDQVLDDLKLPTLLVQPANELSKEPPQPASPVTTLLSPDQVFQVADPVDQLPALFSHGIDQDNGTGPETILLNQNGSVLDEAHNPDELFKPTLPSSSTLASKLSTSTSASSTFKASPLSSLSTKAATTTTKTASFTTKAPSTATTPSKATTLLTTKVVPVTTKAIPAITRPRPLSSTATRTTTRTTTSTQQKSSSAAPSTYKSASTLLPEATTPMSSTTRHADDLVRVPTVAYSGQSGNKKHDELDREEIAINHIISILNDTADAKLTTQVTNGPTTYKWVSPDALVKVSTSYPSSSASPSYSSATVSPNYYHYNTESSQPTRFTDYYGSSSPSSYQTSAYQDGSSGTSSGTTYGYSSKSPPKQTTKQPVNQPTNQPTNQPAPTVIVLGPFGTEYSTVPTPSTPTFSGSTRPVRPSLPTKKPSVATTLTHNISTVISGNKQVVSVSYFSVLKDGTTSKPLKDASVSPGGPTKRPSTIYTTLTSWSEKPSFHLKPATANFHWPEEEALAPVTKPGFTTTGTNCEDETAASDDVNNFPPVRHPELDATATHLQDKPTLVEPGEIISEDEIPTPDFVEDAELNNKVDVFVNKIVESLQGNFQNLKDVVYNPTNATRPAAVTTGATPGATPGATTSLTTRRPPAATTRRPVATTRPPSAKPTRRPATTRLTTTPKAPSTRPKATSSVTKKPVTSKRTKPARKPTTPLPSSEAVANTEATTIARPTEITTAIPEITPNADFRSICGIRPLIKTGRIVGGKGATFGEWPWQVLVREATWLGLFTKNKCGGVLITDKYVITAAHCQPGFLASLVAVFGEFDISGELESRRSVSRNVRRVIVNRAYDPATFENDLALLELETPIQFDAHIVPICMPDDNTDYVNRMATVTGWGRLKYNGGVPSVLQEVKVPIMDNSVCQEMFQTAGHSKLILDSFMCAGYANGQKDSCEGDSGGPLTLQRPDGRWILVGTVSHGIKCAAPFLPGVYMRTTYFKPWLHSITGV